MAVKINNGELGYVASLDNVNFIKSIAEIDKNVKRSAEGLKSTEGIIEKLSRASALYAKGMFEATRTDNLEKYKQKFIDINEEIKRLSKPTFQIENLGLLEQLKLKAREFSLEIEKATTKGDISFFNSQLEETEEQIQRLSNLGKTGFDTMGREMRENGGILQNLQRQASLYSKGMAEATRTDNLEKYRNKLQNINIEIAKLTKGTTMSGGGSKSSYNGLQNSINQISRELPAFTFSAQTGFLAISNNIPILIDEIEKLKVANTDLVASGQKGVPVWKQLISGLFSWGTALSLGVTLLTVYGKEVGDFISSIFNGKSALDKTTSSLKDLAVARLKGSKYAQEELVELKKLYSATQNHSLSLKQRNEAVDQIQESYPSYFSNLTNESILAGNAKKSYEDLTLAILASARARAAQDKMVDLSKNELDNEDKINKYRIMIERHRKEIAATVKERRVSPTGGSTTIGITMGLEAQIESDLKAIDKLEKANKKIAVKMNALSNMVNTETVNAGGVGKVGSTTISDKINSKDGASDHQNLLKEITEIDREYTRKQLESDEEELQALRDKFISIKEEIEKFNVSKQNIVKIDVNQLDPILKKAETDLKYKQDTQKLKTEIENQKVIFEQYEEYKVALGKDSADIRFKDEKAAFDNYGQYLDNKLSEFNGVDLSKLRGSEKIRLELLKIESENHIKLEKKKYDELLKGLISYDQQRRLLIEKYKIDFASLQNNPLAQAELTKKYQQELKVLDESQIKKWDSYKDLFEHLEDLNRKELANRIQLLKDKVAAEVAAGNITIDQANKVYREISAIGRTKDGAGLELVIQRLRTVAGEISSINNDIGSIVGSLANAAVNYMSIAKDFKIMNDSTASQQDQDAAKIGLYAQAANGLLSMVTGITNAAAERKRVTEEFYRSAINFQNQYNLTLIEQARLDSINKRGIFSKDSLAEIKDGVKASGMAMTEYQKKLDNLAKGQAKVGLRNAVDWKSVGSMTATGAATGAAIGSIVPVVGTAVGAVVGGVVGFIGGLFGTKKKKDTYAGLLSEFPELIMKSADGTRVLNTGLAQQLIAQNKVNAATKDYLQAAIDAEKGLAAAREQVNEGIKTLVGSIDDDLRNSLVNAFKAGEDGMKAFESTVGNSMENIIANLAFQAIFNDAFKELEDGMKDSFGLGGDNNIVDDLESFYKLYGSLTKDFDAALTAASQAAKQSGIDIFNKQVANESALKGAIKRELTEQTGSELTGLYRAQFEITKNQLQEFKVHGNLLRDQISLFHNHLLILSSIEQHTLRTANNTDPLSNKLDQIITNTKPGQTTRDMGI